MSAQLTSDSSRRLVTMLQARQPDGFAELLAKYGRLFRWRFLECGMTEAEAEDRAVDLITDIFMHRISSFRGDGSGLSAWLNTLVRNECVDWLRMRKGVRIGSLPDQLESPEPSGVAEDNSTSEIRRIIHPALGSLKPEDRRVLEARVLDGLSHAEIAAELKITESNSKVKFSRALKYLKSILKTHEAALLGTRRKA
jgi:RNA polymerase sigma factor (sigma-70 family)